MSGVGEGDAGKYLIQIVNKPHQVIALKVWHTLGIFFPIKYIAEPVVKVG